MFVDSTARKILVYRLGSLGDTLVALPCLHLIARAFPAAERVLLTNIPTNGKAPAASAVLGGMGLIDGYLRYNVGTRSPLALLQLAAQIRHYAPEHMVWLQALRPTPAVRRDLFFFRHLCGIRSIFGAPTPGDLALGLHSLSGIERRNYDAATGLFEREASRLARTLGALGDARINDPASWDLRLSVAEQARAAAELAPLSDRSLIVCGPGTKMQAKDWGAERWQALLARLSARFPEYGLAMVGAAEESALCAQGMRPWRGAKVNLCGRMTPRETAAVLARAQLFLGPDSGPMHLAASVGTPCVIAFSARGLPGVWYPAGAAHRVLYCKTDCFGCYRESCTERDRECLRAITVEAMEAAAVEQLTAHGLLR